MKQYKTSLKYVSYTRITSVREVSIWLPKICPSSVSCDLQLCHCSAQCFSESKSDSRGMATQWNRPLPHQLNSFFPTHCCERGSCFTDRNRAANTMIRISEWSCNTVSGVLADRLSIHFWTSLYCLWCMNALVNKL